MAKLSTEALRKMMGEWLSTPKALEAIHAFEDTEGAERERLWKLWCNPKNWKRREKRTLGPDGVDKFRNTVYDDNRHDLRGMDRQRHEEPWFDVDCLGEANDALVKKYFDDPKAAERCIERVFEPHDEFADNFRLEVTTTPEDDAVIGWTVIVD